MNLRAFTCALGVAACASSSSPAWAQARRFALVVGENRGLETDEPLRFAQVDARRMSEALIDVGGFSSSEVFQLTGATAQSLRTALQALKVALAQGSNERLIVYISSHAAEGVLHLAGSEFPLAELVDFLKAAPVEVGVLIVDACQSGRVVKRKGLIPKATATQLPRMEASGLSGRVLISASGADEYAQESDALGGSYFTHYFVTGLRGAADASRDGQVTLEEAYAWAWARTIEATFSSSSGVQRPAFSVDLRGEGQVVMAQLDAAASRLTLDIEAPGRWLVVAEATGQVFADLDKGAGPVTLAVPEGRYRIQLRSPDGTWERSVAVPPHGSTTLTQADLERASFLRVARKGGEEARLVASVAVSLSSALVADLSVEPGVELRLRRDAHLLGLLNQIFVSGGWRSSRSATDSFSHSELELRAGTGHRFASKTATLLVGLEVGPMLVLQSHLPNDSSRTSLGLVAGAVFEARVKLGGPLEAVGLATGGGAMLRKHAGLTLIPRFIGQLGMAVAF